MFREHAADDVFVDIDAKGVRNLLLSLLKINAMAVGVGASKEHAGFPSGGSTFIAMVKTTNLREGNDIAERGSLYGTRPWTVLVERKMRSGVMMVLKVAR
jgi:hypothetical protein